MLVLHSVGVLSKRGFSLVERSGPGLRDSSPVSPGFGTMSMPGGDSGIVDTAIACLAPFPIELDGNVRIPALELKLFDAVIGPTILIQRLILRLLESYFTLIIVMLLLWQV